MDPVRTVSYLMNVFIIAITLFLFGFIFITYGDETTGANKLAYALIVCSSLFVALFAIKFTIIFFIKAFRK